MSEVQVSLNTPFEALQTFIAYILHIFNGRQLWLESAPNCGKVGDPSKTECIWDCTWVNSPLYGLQPQTGNPILDPIIQSSGFTYTLIRYPSDIACLKDCTFIGRLQNANTITALTDLILNAITNRSNIDSLLVEVCIIYLQLKLPSCFDLLLRRRRRFGRITGNSITNNYIDKNTTENTLNQYPWTCSLRTRGYRGRHVCGATLLAAPPSSPTIIVSAAHCNYLCKDKTGVVLETCCCRNPKENFASCRTTSSYCGTEATLQLALPSDLLLVCGDWNTGEEPELYSQEHEVVLPITKIIQHPRYTSDGAGPGEGWDIAVYHVDDTNLRGSLRQGVLYPACLPQREFLKVGTRGIFASWKDPRPLYLDYYLNMERTVKRYRDYELLLKHTRVDVIECKDPDWMNSNTFYPRGVICGLDPSTESCFDSGDSGSGLVMPRGDGSYAWVGPLSFYRGCDRAPSISFDQLPTQVTSMSGENPGVKC